jgi:ERCC4-related helicase
MDRRLHEHARSYQTKILERAIRENVIAYVPTGDGKTFISVMLIHEVVCHQASALAPAPPTPSPSSSSSPSAATQDSDQQAVVAARRKHKMIFFLANTVPLVTQQAEVIRSRTYLSVGHYFGEMAPDTGSM